MEWMMKMKRPPIVDGVLVQVYEEAPPRPSAPRPPTKSSRPRDAPPLGYDRKQLLLAYSRQLRRLHSAESDSEPSWSRWKAAFLRSDCQTTNKKKKKSQERRPCRSRTQTWISRVLCRIRCRRKEHHRNDEKPRSCSSSRGPWGRLTARISWMCGCC